ncbi:MAG: tetratricopeptide repeat protein [Opitutaceae bacterium]
MKTRRRVVRRADPEIIPPAAANFLRPRAAWVLVGVVFASALLAYWPALQGTFIWDDAGHVTRHDLRSLAGLTRIWFELGATQQYYPVLHSAFWLEHFAFGDSPTGYHVLNVFLHALAACLFAAVLLRLKVSGAWLAAFLFVLHPVCVESVAWIAEQKNTLSTVFYLLTALAYLRFDASRGRFQYALASLLFFCALGTKTVTATLPAALLVIFWWQRGRLEFRRDVAPLVPWFIFAAVAGGFTAWVEHAFIGARAEDFTLGWWERCLLVSRVIWFYFAKIVYPAELIFIYPRWQIDAGQWWQYVFPLGLGLLALAGWRWRQHRGPIAAGLFFVGSLFPALGFVNIYPFRFSFVADHFQYLASLGIFAAAGAGLARWVAHPSPAAGKTVTLGLLTLLGVLTRHQSAMYRDDITLYTTTLAKNPDAAMAHNNLGNTLVDRGRAREALPHLEAALKLRPHTALYENSLGYALLSLRESAAAIPHFERVLILEPDHVRAQVYLGIALKNLDRKDEAEAKFRAALKLKPDHPEAHLNLGLSLVQRGDFTRALEHFAIATRLRPANPEAVFNLALALVVSNRLSEALPHFETAARLAPDRAYIHNSHGRALALAGDFEAAIARYREALRLDPNFVEAHVGLAQALGLTGRNEEAARYLAEATRLGWKN